ncbi:hypothetical protein C8R43DRAFT_1134316 [Mycena crocata]|nr:hypothetical protein C8R43DRAFT_1134316 [Mycena crocata]
MEETPGSPPPDITPRSSRSPEPSEDEAPGKSQTKSKPTRRVVDFDLDDGDPEWEDEQLEGLGTTTHRSRNRDKPVIPIRKHRRRDPGVNVCATARKRKEEKGSKIAGLLRDLAQWEVEREERVHELAEAHSVKPAEVRRRMLASSNFKTTRKVSVYNAKISRIMANLNEGRDLGERYKIPEVKRMVNVDPSMLEGFTEEEEEEMVAEVLEKRKVRHRGARATNKAAKEDARRTIDRLALEIMALAERAGMVGFAFFTRGHIHDRTVPVTIQSWGAMAFVREILKREPSDVQSAFELWAVSRMRGNFGGESLKEMQKECTAIITTGYQNISNISNGVMNYENYVNSIVKKKGFGLVGWPKETPFKRMSKQSAIGPLRALHTALKKGDCHWKALTPGEKSRILAQFDDMVEKGEVVEKVRKTKGKSAGKSKSKAMAEEEEEEEEEEEADERDEEEGEEEEEAPRKKIKAMSISEKRARLEKLARTTTEARRARGDREDVSEERARKAAKRKAVAEDDHNEGAGRAPPKKKTKRTDGGGVKAGAKEKRGAKGKRKAVAEDDDDEDAVPRKRSKRTVAAGSDNDNEPIRRTGAKPTAGTSKKVPAAKKFANVGVQPARKPANPGVQPGCKPTEARPLPTPSWRGAPAKASGSGSAGGHTTSPPPPPHSPHPPPPSPPLTLPPTASAGVDSESSTPPITQRRNVVKGPKGGPPGRRTAEASASE